MFIFVVGGVGVGSGGVVNVVNVVDIVRLYSVFFIVRRKIVHIYIHMRFFFVFFSLYSLYDETE